MSCCHKRLAKSKWWCFKHTQIYGMWLSHIFEVPSISNESLVFPWILIKILGILNQKFWNTKFFTPWIWNTTYSSKIPSISKRVWNPGFTVDLCMSSSIGFRSYLRIRRLLSKYYTSAQLDRQQKHSTPFVDSFFNSTDESGEVIYK